MHTKIFQSIIGVTAFAALLFAVVVGIETSEPTTNQTAQVSRSISTTTKTSDTDLITDQQQAIPWEYQKKTQLIGRLFNILEGKTLSEKADSSYVFVLKRLINELELSEEPLEFTSLYDNSTRKVVAELNQMAGLGNTPEFTPQTLAALQGGLRLFGSRGSVYYDANKQVFLYDKSVQRQKDSPLTSGWDDPGYTSREDDVIRCVLQCASGPAGEQCVQDCFGQGGGTPITGNNTGGYVVTTVVITGSANNPSDPIPSGQNPNPNQEEPTPTPAPLTWPSSPAWIPTFPGFYGSNTGTFYGSSSNNSGTPTSPGGNNQSGETEQQSLDIEQTLLQKYQAFLNTTIPTLDEYTLQLTIPTTEPSSVPDILSGGWAEGPILWYQNFSETPLGQVLLPNIIGNIQTGIHYVVPDLVGNPWSVNPGGPNWGPQGPFDPPEPFPDEEEGERERADDELGEQPALQELLSILEGAPNQKYKYIYNNDFELERVESSDRNEIWIENSLGEQELILVEGNIYVDLSPPYLFASTEAQAMFVHLINTVAERNATRLLGLMYTTFESLGIEFDDVTQVGHSVGEAEEIFSRGQDLFDYIEESESEYVLRVDDSRLYNPLSNIVFGVVMKDQVEDGEITENITLSTPLNIISTMYMNLLEERHHYAFERALHRLREVDVPSGEISNPDVPYYIRYSNEETEEWTAWEHNYIGLSSESYIIEKKNTGRVVLTMILEDVVSDYLSDDYKNHLNQLLTDVYAPVNPSNMLEENPLVERIPEIPVVTEFTTTGNQTKEILFYDIYNLGY